MKASHAVLLALLGVGAIAEQKNPLGAVLGLLSSLESKIIKEGEVEAKAYQEFFQWCDKQARNLKNEIKTDRKYKEKYGAKVGQLRSDIQVSRTKIQELAASTSTESAELQEATRIRKKEAEDFQGSASQLQEAIDTISRATQILEKEANKGGAAFAQIDASQLENVIQSVGAVVEAAGFETNDYSKLVALMQANSGDEELGAPKAASYKSHGGGIIDVLEDMKEKAQGLLSDARKTEVTARQNFKLMAQSLKDQIEADTKDLDEEKGEKAGSKEEKAISKGDLGSTKKELTTDKKSRKGINQDCMTAASDHEATVAARKVELKVIRTATKVLQETTGGAKKQAGYDFLQVESHSYVGLPHVVGMLRQLAREQKSVAMTQLVSRVSSVMKYGSRNGANPFAKVSGLLRAMIMKLSEEANSESTEKDYCDEQMAKTKAKKGDLEDTLDKQTSKIDKAAARSAALKEQMSTLQSELAELSKSQAQMDKMRQQEKGDYTVAKKELEEGLGGVRKAIEVIRDYYGGGEALLQEDDDEDASLSSFMQQPKPPQKHAKASGAAGSLMGFLEVIESDFATNLAKDEAQESDAISEYDKTSEENKIAGATKEQDLKYKIREAAGLDKKISEQTSDRENVLEEKKAVLDFDEKIRARCIAQPESHEVRKARREAEIDGLKGALESLSDQGAFVQERKRGRHGRFMGL